MTTRKEIFLELLDEWECAERQAIDEFCGGAAHRESIEKMEAEHEEWTRRWEAADGDGKK